MALKRIGKLEALSQVGDCEHEDKDWAVAIGEAAYRFDNLTDRDSWLSQGEDEREVGRKAGTLRLWCGTCKTLEGVTDEQILAVRGG